MSATTWKIDPTHTLVEFSAKHMMITTVKGRFGDVAGTITFDPESTAGSVTAEIGAASIDTRTAQRDEHLRSPDFLNVEGHPAISFRSTGTRGSFRRPGDQFVLEGELTIRGTTRPVALEVEYQGMGKDPWGGERASFSAATRIDRRDFGLTWNQALETGGILVSNEIRIALEVQATRSA